jgi:TolB-like protein/Tfp pilus assembly protein PilF
VQAVIRLYREARRRKVFRTAALYVLGAWAALQVAALMFPGFGIPESAIRALIWAATLGLPVAVVFGWLFEIGPGGIHRTAPAEAGEAAEPQALTRRDYLILAAFAAIAVVLVFRTAQDVRETPKDSLPAEVGGMAGERLENSIAVLPFTNISDDPANEYFCDGISDEILNKLGGIPELKVIGRTSSFAFKGSDYGIERISALLRVRYVLQGSVRKAGDQLRVSAQLLDAGGVQVWSESFDRQLENVFQIQSEIAGAVASTVASQVVPETDVGHEPNLDAYEHYLAGRTLLHRRDLDRAREELQRAVELDPQFAEAYAELAIIQAFEATPEAIGRARASVKRALQLKPRLVRARAAEALFFLNDDPRDLAGAERVLREVLDQDPNMSDALNWLSGALREQGRHDEARTILERAAVIDPLHPSIAANLADRLNEAGETERAARIYERAMEQPNPSPLIFGAATRFYQSTGRLIELNIAQKRAALRDPTFSSLFFLLLSYSVLGDWPQVEAVNERLMRATPEGPGRVFRALILPSSKGQTDVTVQRLREALSERRMTFADLDLLERLIAGVHLVRGGDYAAAIDALEPVVDIEFPGRAFIPGSFIHGAHALAFSYMHTGADAKAERLLATEARECSGLRADGRLRDSFDLHRCAQTELLLGNIEQALAGLEKAVEAGWRDYYVHERDPLWASVASDPRYRALLAKVKADVDRQRAEVRRIDVSERFIEKLDAAIAAKSPREE